MTATDETKIYKVMTASAWRQSLAAGAFNGSADDLRDGFIHLSAGPQLQGTLSKHYRNMADLMLIAYDATSLGPELRWEVSRGGELFPHLYGPLPSTLALSVLPLLLGDDGVPLLPPENN
jgi:uncharacterized protein (DUF952 family)